MILKTPESWYLPSEKRHAYGDRPELFNPGKLGDGEDVQPGDLVLVSYRRPGDRSKIDLLAAEVMAITSYKGLPVFKLRSLDGQAIQNGDSGGGIWLNGKLVGNMWATLAFTSLPEATSQIEISQDATTALSDRSYAAVLPTNLILTYQMLDFSPDREK